jgi:GNAT superfamily N-acetyltransferase
VPTAAAALAERTSAYLAILVAPTDGMWEGAIIPQARCWDITDDGEYAGYCRLDADNVLLRFHLTERYRAQAATIFRWLLASRGIRRAIASTGEARYFAVALDRQTGIVPHSYLFRDHRRVAPPLAARAYTFRRAEPRELAALTRFYRAHVRDAGEWVADFLRERLAGGELFGLYAGACLIATGECIPSRLQPSYADLGMVVAAKARGQGLGRAVLIGLKERCYAAGWEPICSCAADNPASRRAIEHAGFISEQRMVTLLFAEGAEDGQPD